MTSEPSEDVPPGGERIVTYAADALGPGWVVLAALLVALPVWLYRTLRRRLR